MKPNYSGLDWLKFAAAILVVANHTGPLQSFSPYADFLLSGVLTRVAVPVFFMSSGFFLFRKLTGDSAADLAALHRYAAKAGKLYVIAIALYIPLNLYTGYFITDFSVYSMIKDLVFDGTLYHLWYLPALLIGIYLTFFLYKRMSMKGMLAAAGILYAIGMLGGSYYGIIEGHQGFVQIYDGMFTLFDYTRNGLFYAPVYIALGAWAAKQPNKEGSGAVQAGLFAASLGMMFAEGILLHAADIPRHEGMYMFALPASYYLFRWALHWRGRSGKGFREWRVWIYILHPYAIVLVRGASEAVHLDHLFIQKSMLHFAAVCLLSIVMAAAAVKLEQTPRIIGQARKHY
ncbi:acyltransferase family protein [Paenibacillus arenilitoris]|uniref:Acyltransferase n=1 Tax=Paenibacillus arenilitoris TaxID=2772299 RepID=A0A927CTH6_9BACL|nr:acyltransferase [Paenibacillus arenilitoris]MBD2872947.1 acyltransferase [Paenibacillus arenilitoris]